MRPKEMEFKRRDAKMPGISRTPGIKNDIETDF